MKRLLAGAATAIFLAAPVQAQDASTVLATVNGTDITLGHVIALLGRLPPQYQNLADETLYQGILDQLVQQQILSDNIQSDLTTADRLGWENEERGYLSSRFLNRFNDAPVDEADVQALYDEQFGSVDPDPEFNASHILVETEAEAQALIAELDDGADFAELAREHSTGPSGPNGGNLGWFGLGQMVPPFEEAVVALEPESVSAPVETQFGWHVIRLNEQRQAAVPSLDDVREDLENAVRDQAVEAQIQALRDAAEVTMVDVEIDPALIRNTDLLE